MPVTAEIVERMRQELNDVIAMAESAAVCISIERRTPEPLRMGGAVHAADAWPKHGADPTLIPMRLQRWRHLKTGGLYKILAVALVENGGGDQDVIYQNVDTGQIWSRPHQEFFDGRFALE